MNELKRLLLGDMHLPGRAQSALVISAADRLSPGGGRLLNERIWQNWFSGISETPQAEKLQALDDLFQIARSMAPKSSLSPIVSFADVATGGLMASLRQPTKSKHTKAVLFERAAEYAPADSLALHLDAIDVAATTAGTRNVDADYLRSLGARRVLELLHQRWNPRTGSVYGELKSDFALRWQSADEGERLKLKVSADSWKPSMFPKLMEMGAAPRWEAVPVSADVAPEGMCRLMLCMAADPSFLVEERLARWAVDSVTALLATFGLAWSNRYLTFSHLLSPEAAYVIAFRSVFLDDEPIEENLSGLECALDLCGLELGENLFRPIWEGRESYRQWIADLGLAPDLISQTLSRTTEICSLRYRA